MQLTLIKKNVIYHYVLPEKVKGQYWITHVNNSGDEERIISVEGIEGSWLLKSNRGSVIQNEKNQKVKELIIEPQCFYSIFIKNSNERVLLFTEPITDDRSSFQKLLLTYNCKFSIGRAESNDILFLNRFVSSSHAEISFENNKFIITDLKSSNGTFVNGIRIQEKNLDPGDMIYIMGLKIIIGKNFIAINNPDNQVTYNEGIFKKFIKQNAEIFDEEDETEEEKMVNSLFYPSPRFKRDVTTAVIKIDPPTPLGNTEETPLMLMLGPSMTMGMASLFTGLFTLENVMRRDGNIMNAMPTLVMSFSMLLGTILWPILTKRYEKKRRIKREKIRQEKYRKYIQDMRNKISGECNYQSEILNENYVTVDDCIARIKMKKRNLWERLPSHNDFLRIRLGIGDLPLEADINYPERRFTIDEDNLQEELYKLAEEPKMLRKVPITLSLVDEKVLGIIGKRDNVVNLVKSLIIQLTALHSYEDLKLIFLYDKKEQNIWSFVKWLPYVWNNDKTIRLIATNENEAKELFAYLEKEISFRESMDESELEYISSYFVIFAMSKKLINRVEVINSILKQKKNIRVSIITLFDELKNLPKECSMVVELSDDVSKIYDKNDISGKYTAFQPEGSYTEYVDELAVNLANIQLDNVIGAQNMPNMLTFLEMFQVGKIEHLNSLTRWKENDPTITLETPIGVDTAGELFKLDLHEKYHGPHGLIAGMTGSGKSEFIMTFILSLAVNYHPNEIAFILIDYKGGGMANTFENLPHLAGTITNLDGAAVKRSLVSIQSELKRRQAIFSDTSKKVNVSNIDIYKYQKLYRDGVVKEPLQHLFIISDEFAELKTQQPEFMEQLVSAARIGRSLGVHLILATQKPSGVVDDQIWSNSKFRICLKVQEKADSMDVIKRPDAAELSVTGRYYVQVGFNELFELGQSAWSGAPYYPGERFEKKEDDSVIIIDKLGRVIKQMRVDKGNKYYKNPPKQIDQIVEYLSELAKEENIKVRQLWLEPIPELIYVNKLKKKYNYDSTEKFILNPVIGEVDDPTNQRQFLMTLPITEEGNVIIYGAAGSGKTTFLTTLIYSLIEEHTPEEVNLYILDFASETLRSFGKAPHVGDVILSHEAEKINNLFKMISQEIDKRKKMFSDFGGDYLSYVNGVKKPIASIVIIIHNYSSFAEGYENKEEIVNYLTREGKKYGIYFIISTLNTSAIRYRLLQNFKQLFVLQMNDTTDYSTVLGNVYGLYPSKYKGRGIFKTDEVYEFQVAHPSSTDVNMFEFIMNYCNEISKNCSYASAKRIPILPEKIDLNYLMEDIHRSPDNMIPVGIDKESLNTCFYNFEDSYINLILSQNNDEADFVQGLAEVLAAKEKSKIIIIDSESKFRADKEKKYDYFNGEANLDEVVVELFNTLVYRNNNFKEAKEKGEKLPCYEKVTYIINSLSGLMLRLTTDSVDKLKVLFEKGDKAYNVSIIISESINNISTMSYESWFKSQVSSGGGIWLRNGIRDQYILKITKLTNDLYKEIGDDFGYIVDRGKVKFIKLLKSAAEVSEEEFNG